MCMLESDLNEYRLTANVSLRRNEHMNGGVMLRREDIHQEIVDAILVDFLNYIAKNQGLDYGLHTRHLKDD